MSTLQELKAKWFVDVSLAGQFPPQTRHPGTQIQPHTDGNLVEPVVHAKVMMVDDELALVGSANVCQRSMTYHNDTRFQPTLCSSCQAS